MSNIIGVRNNSTIVPYSAATKRTKTISVTNDAHIVLSGTSISNSVITRAAIMAYADSLGNWRLRFNIRLSCTSSGVRTEATVTFASTYAVTFKNVSNYFQEVGVSCTDAISIFAAANPGAATITINHTSSNQASYKLSGDIELDSKPSWADANMEGVTAVDVYIEPASATEVGLVTTGAQTFAGVKTFSSGISLGNEKLDVYDEGSFTVISQGPWTATTQNLSFRYVRIGKQVTIVASEAIFATNKSQTIVVPAANGFQASLRPTSDQVQWLIPSYESTGYPSRPGRFTLFSDGSCEIFQQWDGASFAGSGNGGYLAHTACYTIA